MSCYCLCDFIFILMLTDRVKNQPPFNPPVFAINTAKKKKLFKLIYILVYYASLTLSARGSTLDVRSLPRSPH